MPPQPFGSNLSSRSNRHFQANAGANPYPRFTPANGKADFQIDVHNLTDDLHSLAKGDFIL